jgi:hypothetical protein
MLEFNHNWGSKQFCQSEDPLNFFITRQSFPETELKNSRPMLHKKSNPTCASPFPEPSLQLAQYKVSGIEAASTITCSQSSVAAILFI